jgi:hypothetical protein
MILPTPNAAMSYASAANSLADPHEPPSGGVAGQAVTRPHRNGPDVVAGHTPATEQLVGGQEARCCRTFHEGNREVAANAVTGQHDPRMGRVDGEPLFPRAGA